jgi:hypothetical protein
MDGRGCPIPGYDPNPCHGGTDMNDPKAGVRRIEISDEAYDVLARTAERRGTDIDGALRYLMEVPAVSAPAAGDEDED